MKEMIKSLGIAKKNLIIRLISPTTPNVSCFVHVQTYPSFISCMLCMMIRQKKKTTQCKNSPLSQVHRDQFLLNLLQHHLC